MLALNGSVPLFGFGLAVTPEVPGPVLSTTRLTVTGVAPVALGVLAVDRDDVRALGQGVHDVAAGIVPSRLAIGAPVLTVMAVPVAVGRRRSSMKYSAAVMFEPPEAVSSPVAVTATPAPRRWSRLGVSGGATRGRAAGVARR